MGRSPVAEVRLPKPERGLPVVFVDTYFEERDRGFHRIGLDDFQGGYRIAEYVLSRGHRRALFLANDDVHPGGDRFRFEGCRRAFADRGLEFGEDRFVVVPGGATSPVCTKVPRSKRRAARCYRENRRVEIYILEIGKP